MQPQSCTQACVMVSCAHGGMWAPAALDSMTAVCTQGLPHLQLSKAVWVVSQAQGVKVPAAREGFVRGMQRGLHSQHAAQGALNPCPHGIQEEARS